MASSWKNKITKSFDRSAPQYDCYADIQKNAAEYLIRDLPENVIDILEIGCGTGLLTTLLAQKYQGRSLHISDISTCMLERALRKTNYPEIIGFSLDAEKENTGKSYDLIVGNMVCHWFEDLQKGLKNLLSMLHEGGSLFFTIPGPRSFCEWRDILSRLSLPCGFLNFHEPQEIYRREIFFQPVTCAHDFLQSIKNTGAFSSPENYKNLSVPALKKACKEFDINNAGFMTWEILFIHITKKSF